MKFVLFAKWRIVFRRLTFETKVFSSKIVGRMGLNVKQTKGNWREMWKWTVKWIAQWRTIDFAECFLSRKKYVYRKINKPSSGFAYSLMNAGKTNGIPVFHVSRSCASQNLSIFSLTSGWVPCRMGMSFSWQPSKRIFPCECQRFGNWIFLKFFQTQIRSLWFSRYRCDDKIAE